MQTLQVELFARLTIRRGTVTITRLPIKAQELLCYLLLYHGHQHTREALACELWADAPVAQSRKYLRQCLWQLQQALDPQDAGMVPLLRLDQEWVALHPDAAVQVDVLQFERAFAAVRDQPGALLSQQQAHTAQAAVNLYHGELLSGWYHTWCLVERARYESLFVALLDKLIDYCAAHRLFDQGIGYSMALLRIEHAREQTHRQLMWLYALAGDRSMALRQFDRCAAAVMQEFGVRPNEETLALRDHIRAGQIETLPPEAPPGLVALAMPNHFTAILAELTSLRTSVVNLQHEIEHLKQGSQPE